MRRDVLLIGTPNNLLAYDVEENRDLFFRDVPDGVTSCLVGKVREREREGERSWTDARALHCLRPPACAPSSGAFRLTWL